MSFPDLQEREQPPEGISTRLVVEVVRDPEGNWQVRSIHGPDERLEPDQVGYVDWCWEYVRNVGVEESAGFDHFLNRIPRGTRRAWLVGHMVAERSYCYDYACYEYDDYFEIDRVILPSYIR